MIYKSIGGWCYPALLVILLAAGRLFAAVQVDARLDTTEIHIGDPLTLILSVRTDPGQSVQFPDPAEAMKDFEFLSAGAPEHYDEGGGAALERRSYRLTTFETGKQTLPALPFIVMTATGAVDTVYTRELSLDVQQTLQDTTSTQIRPLKALIEVPPLWHRMVLWALAGLLVLAGLIYLWRRWLAAREERLRGVRALDAPKRPAHLVALDELDRIKAQGLIEKGEIKQFHILVSDAIRSYIEDLYSVGALDRTTWELVEVLRLGLRLDDDLVRRFQEFLEACDLVKFAKYKPPIVEINSVFNHAYDLVERTRPVPPLPATRETDGRETVQAAASGASGRVEGEGQ